MFSFALLVFAFPVLPKFVLLVLWCLCVLVPVLSVWLVSVLSVLVVVVCLVQTLSCLVRKFGYSVL